MTTSATANHVALVISDVDGTLLDNNKQLSPGAPAAVQRLYAGGLRFSIASARPPQMVRDLVSRLSVREPLACFNGALIVSPDAKVLHKVCLIPADAQAAADRILSHGFDLWVWTEDDWYVTNADGPHVAHHAAEMGRKPTLLTNRNVKQYEVLKLVGVSDDHDALAEAEKEMAGMGVDSISATRSSPYYLDVTAAEANKGAAVVAISDRLQIALREIATIGDMITDTLMFRQSGISIAMGNAFPDVKAQATFVTRSNEENGFGYAMDHFVLGISQPRAGGR
jgi:Cof subfamily protein (haloacid dehalogenase superfamily)